MLFGNWSAFEGLAITELLSSIWVSGLSIGLSATRWKLAALRGLSNKEVAAAFKMAALSASILPKAIAASII